MITALEALRTVLTEILAIMRTETETETAGSQEGVRKDAAEITMIIVIIQI